MHPHVYVVCYYRNCGDLIGFEILMVVMMPVLCHVWSKASVKAGKPCLYFRQPKNCSVN